MSIGRFFTGSAGDVSRLGVRIVHRRWRGLGSTVAIYLASVLFVLVVWQWAASHFDIYQLFPPPSEVVGRLGTLLGDGTLIEASAYSVLRVLAGFILGGLLGVVIGLLMGTSTTLMGLFDPYVNFFRFIPVFAWFGPVLLWFGANEMSIVLLIAYATFFVVVINTIAGVSQVSRDSLRMARAFGADRRQSFLHVSAPGTLPYILTGLRLAIGNSFMTVIAAEFLQSNAGLGFLLSSFQNFFDMPGIFGVVVCLGFLGFIADRVYVIVVSRVAGRYLPAGRIH